MTPDRNGSAQDLLAFYAEAGVDALVGEKPVDRFAAAEPAPQVARASASDRTAVRSNNHSARDCRSASSDR